MSFAATLIVILGVLVFSSLADPVLEQMHTSRRAAWCLLAILLTGELLPLLTVGGVRLNLGAMVASLTVGLYFLLGLDHRREVVGTLLVSVCVCTFLYLFISRVPGAMEGVAAFRDPFLGLVCGMLCAAILRKPRSAVAGGMLGVVLLDLVISIRNYARGEDAMFLLGHTGLMDGVMTASVAGAIAGYLLHFAVVACARRFRRKAT